MEGPFEGWAVVVDNTDRSGVFAEPVLAENSRGFISIGGISRYDFKEMIDGFYHRHGMKMKVLTFNSYCPGSNVIHMDFVPRYE